MKHIRHLSLSALCLSIISVTFAGANAADKPATRATQRDSGQPSSASVKSPDHQISQGEVFKDFIHKGYTVQWSEQHQDQLVFTLMLDKTGAITMDQSHAINKIRFSSTPDPKALNMLDHGKSYTANVGIGTTHDRLHVSILIGDKEIASYMEKDLATFSFIGSDSAAKKTVQAGGGSGSKVANGG